jgi:hypothetical protein
MARPLRIEFPGAVYHVTSRGNAKQAISIDDEDRSRFFEEMLKGTLVQIQLCIAKEKILTAARQRGYRFKQKLTFPNGRNRILLDVKITKRFMT